MNECRRPRILVAEDSRTIAKVVQRCLERAQFRVEVADGLAAWQAAQRQDFDLVVTDEQMPRLSGCELCQRLRDDKRYASVPVIFLTAKQLELSETLLKDELRVTAIIGKPFSPEALARMVRAQLADVALGV